MFPLYVIFAFFFFFCGLGWFFVCVWFVFIVWLGFYNVFSSDSSFQITVVAASKDVPMLSGAEDSRYLKVYYFLAKLDISDSLYTELEPCKWLCTFENQVIWLITTDICKHFTYEASVTDPC